MDTQYEVPVALAAICGLRRGECLALTVDDIDFNNRRIRINKQLNDIEKQAVIGDPKSEESNRTISAPEEVFNILRRHIQQNEKNKLMLADEYKDYKLVVCQNDGDYVRPVYFSKNFTRFIEKHKLKKIRFHDLRHSCASLMLKSGIAMKTASNILGHSSIGITADLYTHVLDETKQAAALQIGKEVFGSNDMGMLETESNNGARSIVAPEPAEKDGADSLLEKILHRDNLNAARLKEKGYTDGGVSLLISNSFLEIRNTFTQDTEKYF
ncbi:site-specific integrase [Sporomusa sp.]|uniref:site-specific integrase n=1 Tax=Sporomusa sp. TaxID=2078658 RepID=UPI002C038CB8|nr:site-specific integrase [Sporomusa sp.]HWR44199.1 site-specific integrase [Sporomusa sp.]